jgi:hypothetical protein
MACILKRVYQRSESDGSDDGEGSGHSEGSDELDKQLHGVLSRGTLERLILKVGLPSSHRVQACPCGIAGHCSSPVTAFEGLHPETSIHADGVLTILLQIAVHHPADASLISLPVGISSTLCVTCRDAVMR